MYCHFFMVHSVYATVYMQTVYTKHCLPTLPPYYIGAMPHNISLVFRICLAVKKSKKLLQHLPDFLVGTLWLTQK